MSQYTIKKYANIEIKSYNMLYDYIDITILKNKNITSISWEQFKTNLLQALEIFKKNKKKFGLIFDLNHFKLLSIIKIKEIIKIFESHSDLLENQLIATSIITKNESIINALFNIIKKFYKTKKPLTFVKDMYNANQFIQSNMVDNNS